MRLFPLMMLAGMLAPAAAGQIGGPEISLDGRILLAQNAQAPSPGYYRPVAPQARQAPCGGFGTPPCTGQTIQDTGPTGEQLFIAAKQADANHQPEKSIDYLTRSAEMGYRKAQYALGADYRDGRGVPKDATKAEYWLNLAAEQGSTSAQADIGAMDPGKAIHYLQMGADQRDAQSEFNLGLDYELGHGVPHDRAKAMEYFRRASRDGGHNAGNEIAAALSRSAASRRFVNSEALMALVPPPPSPPPVPAGCPEEHYFTGYGVALWTGVHTFCYQNPSCPVHVVEFNLTYAYTCDAARYTWK